MTEIGRLSFTNFAQMASLPGPTGSVGAQGPAGPSGPTGPSGASGASGAAGGGGGGGSDPSASFGGVEDFFGVPTSLANGGWIGGALGLSLTKSGTAAALTSVATPNNTTAGVIQLDTGTTSSGFAQVQSANNQAVPFGGAGYAPYQPIYGFGKFITSFRIKVNDGTASTSGQRYVARVGVHQSVSSAAPDGGIWFVYSDNVNGGNWQANWGESLGFGTENADCGVAPTFDWQTLSIVTDDPDTQGPGGIDYYIDGALVAQMWEYPYSRDNGAVAAGIWKSVGTGHALLNVDYMSIAGSFTDPVRGTYP